MADASVYAQYQGSKGIKSGGVWEDGAFTNEDWRPTWRRYKGLVRQAKPMYQNYFDKDDEATAMAQMKAFIKANLTGLSRGPDDNYVDNIQNIDELYAILGQASHDSYNLAYKTQDGYDEPHSAFTEPLKRALGEYSNFLNLVTELENKGLNTKQINQFLSSNKVQGKDSSTLAELANNIDGFSTSEIANYGVQNDLDDPESYQMTDADVAEGSALSTEDTIEQANETILAGDATNPDDLTPVTDADGNVVDGEFTDADGKTVYLGADGKYRYEDGEEYISPDQNTVIRDTQEAQAAAGEARDELIAATEDYGNFVDSAITSLNSAENDFAQQFTDAANEFLYGSAITPENAASKGFTLSDDGTYTGPDGRSYTVGTGNTLVDSDGNALRTDGFRDYQTQMQDANATYQSEMGTLRGEYDQAYTSYESELNPYRDQMDSATAGLMEVARDANDTNYYGRLTDLYYQDSKEEIDRNARGAQETLNSTYANAGMDPSSPAYTQAIMDLENKRADSSRSARRQAILDSYGLGTQMLTNRTNALSNAQVGIGRSMDALGDLYDVKLEGLGVERDMISTMYAGKMDAAKTGMEGLNVSAGLQRDTINANQNQFYKNLDLTSGLYGSKINAANSLYGTMQNTTNTGLDRLQNYQNQQIDWRLAGASLLGTLQANDIDPSTLDLDDRTKEALGWND